MMWGYQYFRKPPYVKLEPESFLILGFHLTHKNICIFHTLSIPQKKPDCYDIMCSAKKNITIIQHIWVNHNISLTWILRPFWDDSPYFHHDSRARENRVRSWWNLPRTSCNAILLGLRRQKVPALFNHRTPALDRVEEADLQNPPMHGALRKGFFLRGSWGPSWNHRETIGKP